MTIQKTVTISINFSVSSSYKKMERASELIEENALSFYFYKPEKSAPKDDLLGVSFKLRAEPGLCRYYLNRLTDALTEIDPFVKGEPRHQIMLEYVHLPPFGDDPTIKKPSESFGPEPQSESCRLCRVEHSSTVNSTMLAIDLFLERIVKMVESDDVAEY